MRTKTKFKVGDIVVPHEFEDGSFVSKMREFLDFPQKIIGVSSENIYLLETSGYWWPEAALAPCYETKAEMDKAMAEADNVRSRKSESKPQYDLKEFVLAALTGLCANSHIITGDRNSLSTESLSSFAFNIAKATIELLEK